MTDRVLGLATPLLFAAGLGLAGFTSILALYAAGARDGSWLLGYGVATILALALPVALAACHERWQVRHGLHRAVPDTTTKALNVACGVFGFLLLLSAIPVFLLYAWFGWVFWQDSMPMSTLYFAVVGAAVLAEPVMYLLFHDRWGRRNGLG